MNHSKEKLNEILERLKSLEDQIKSKSSPSISDYISEQEARKKFHRGTTWFWDLRKSGFPYTKLGGQVYYKLQDLVDYLEKNRKGGPR